MFLLGCVLRSKLDLRSTELWRRTEKFSSIDGYESAGARHNHGRASFKHEPWLLLSSSTPKISRWGKIVQMTSANAAFSRWKHQSRIIWDLCAYFCVASASLLVVSCLFYSRFTCFNPVLRWKACAKVCQFPLFLFNDDDATTGHQGRPRRRGRERQDCRQGPRGHEERRTG